MATPFTVFLDLETFWSDDYTLKKMTPLEYALDARFSAHGAGVCYGPDGAPFWVHGADLPAFFASIDWAQCDLVTHNALFDACVLAFRYHVHPGRTLCTMSMARAWCRHKTHRVSLDAVSKHYGLSPKMGTVHKTKNWPTDMLRNSKELYDEVMTYGCDDVAKCRHIYYTMLEEGFPRAQLDVLDMVHRMATRPAFVLDQNLLLEYQADIAAAKTDLLAATGLDNRDELMSDAKFAELLSELGVEPPVKLSKTTGKEIFAFAKTDAAMEELENDEDPRVQALVAARLGYKSTIEETRCQRLLDISNLPWRDEWPYTLPVPLNYSGAHTHRFSGAWQLNLQNLGKTSKLRRALRAPPGYVVVSIDASQIEARVLATLAYQHDLVNQFKNGEDVYASFASEIYGQPITKQSNPMARELGKIGILSLGYGAGWRTFQTMCRVKSNGNIILHDEIAQSVVGIYRRRYNFIDHYWKTWDAFLMDIADGKDLKFGSPFGPVAMHKDKLELPSGLFIYYGNLRQEMRDDRLQWVYDYGNFTKKIYGPKVVENITQALAFLHIMECAVRIFDASLATLWPAHQVHDELIYIVPEDMGDQVGKMVAAEFSKSPTWLPDAPLGAEHHIGPSYGEAK